MQHSHPDTASVQTSEQPLEYLAFCLGKEEYGIDIQFVRELRQYEDVTRIANAPAHVKGVINLRGVIVPIIDMRMRFSSEPLTFNHSTVLIIVGVAARTVGLVVDSVSDVVDAAALDIKPAPSLSNMDEQSGIVGLGSIEERMLILLDMPKCLRELDESSAGAYPIANAA